LLPALEEFQKMVENLLPLRTVRVDVGGQPITSVRQITTDARAVLDRPPPSPRWAPAEMFPRTISAPQVAVRRS
jgi:hypothetical protein